MKKNRKNSGIKKSKAQSLEIVMRGTPISIIFRKILIWLTVFAVFVLPLWFNPATSQMFELDKAMVLRGLGFLGIFIMSVILVEEKHIPKIKSKLFLSMLIYFGVYVLATVLSESFVESFFGSYYRSQGLISMGMYVFFAFVVFEFFQTPKDFLRLFVSLLIGAGLVALYGVMQRMGIDFFDWKEMAFDKRVFSTFGQPALLGVYLSFVIPIAISGGVFFLVRRKRFMGISSLLISLISILSLVFTQSRGALIALIVGVMVFFLLLAFRSSVKRGILAITGVGLILVVIISSIYVDSPFKDNLRTYIRFENATYKTRLLYAKGAWEGLLDRPILGHGPESMYTTFGPYYDIYAANTEGVSITADRAHNEILDIGYTTGFIGILAYLLMLGLMGYRMFVTVFREKNPYGVLIIGLFSGIVGLFVGQLFLFSLVATGLLLFVSIALFSKDLSLLDKEYRIEKVRSKEIKQQTIFVLMGGGIVTMILIGMLSVGPVMADIDFRKSQDTSDVVKREKLLNDAISLSPNHLFYDLQKAQFIMKAAGYYPEEKQFDEYYRAFEIIDGVTRQFTCFDSGFQFKGQIANILGVLSGDVSWFDISDESYIKATSISPEKAWTYLGYSQALYTRAVYSSNSTGLIDQALGYANKAFELFNNKHSQFYHNTKTTIGRILNLAGRYKETLEVMKDAFKPARISFDSVEARLVVGEAYFNLDRYDEARKSFEKALNQDPTNTIAREYLVKIGN